jgi:cytochrome bd-type quinol oxidase subunit 2
MTLAELVLSIMFVGLIAYGLFGGADFGAGTSDLLAGGTRAGRVSVTSSSARSRRSGRPTTSG